MMQYAGLSVVLPGRAAPLNALVTHCGFRLETSTEYSWEGLKRGKDEFAVLQYTLGGRGRLRYESEYYDVLPGLAMVLRLPQDHHYYLPPDSPQWEFVYVILNGSEVFRIWHDIVARCGPLVRLAREGAAVKAVWEILGMVRDGRMRTPFDSSRMAYTLAMHLAAATIGMPATAPRTRGVTDAIALASDGVGAQITVDDMARRAGYSRCHFSRLFAASEGVTPGAFIREQRIHQAVRLLQTTRMTVKQIAGECGFYDATYFCKAFHRAMGMSPRAFRKSGMY